MRSETVASHKTYVTGLIELYPKELSFGSNLSSVTPYLTPS